MIAQSLHGYFIQIPPEIITALNLPENTSFECSLCGSVIQLTPVSGNIDISLQTPQVHVQPFTINCFGKFQLLFHGTPVPIRNKKAKELLSLLVCEQGHFLSKKKAAATLWPASNPVQAMNSLYKLCQYFKNAAAPLSLLPLTIENQSLSLDLERIDSDLSAFMQLSSPKSCDFLSCYTAAEALYTAPLLFDECYDWIAPYEAYYEIRYQDILQHLITYYRQIDNHRMAEYYQEKLF